MKNLLKGIYVGLSSLIILVVLATLSYLLTNMQTPYPNYLLGFLRFAISGIIVFGSSVYLSYYLIHLSRIGYEKIFIKNEKNS